MVTPSGFGYSRGLNSAAGRSFSWSANLGVDTQAGVRPGRVSSCAAAGGAPSHPGVRAGALPRPMAPPNHANKETV